MNNDKFKADAVHEIVDFLKSGRLFHEPFDLSKLKTFSIKLFSELDRVERYRDPEVKDAYITGTNWNDVLRRSGREYSKIARDCSSAEHAELDNRVRTLFFDSWPHSELNVTKILGADYAGDVSTMINSIMYHRALTGVIKNHFDTLSWEILKLGGFPCGWHGAADDGCLAVYISSAG